MPELPEVERVRRTLEPVLIGARVSRVRVHRRDAVVVPGDPPGGWSRTRHAPTPRPLRHADLLLGCTIERLDRRGKQLAIVSAEGPLLCAHLGMSGQLLRLAPGARPAQGDHVHVVWSLEGRGRLLYRDPRRFGGVWTFPSRDELLGSRWAALGPDALEATGGQLRARAGGSRRAIKGALLDQGVVAGVGNIYADEALFGAGIDPARPARDLEPGEWDRLASALHAALRRAIRAGGSTIRDYRDSSGASGTAQLAHAVYGRAGQACRKCGGELEATPIAQRTTVRCPRCQR